MAALIVLISGLLESGCPRGYVQQATFFRAGSPANAGAAGASSSSVIACEDFSTDADAIVFVQSTTGVPVASLPKRFATTIVADTDAYLNYSKSEVLTSPADLLGNRLLEKKHGFTMNDVAAAVPPIRTFAHTRTFVGSRGSIVDISLDETLTDLNTLGLPTILSAITLPGGALNETRMEEGLIGGILPCLAFRFPDTSGTATSPSNPGGWWEIDYVPDANATENQPVYIRFARTTVDGKLLEWSVATTALRVQYGTQLCAESARVRAWFIR